jgi:hypothetical protein
MNSSKRDIDHVVRLFLLFLLYFFHARWHSTIFSPPTLCYIEGRLPLLASGELDLASLNQMNWEMLPIDLLWESILNNPAVSDMLIDHCKELDYNYILWICKSDPLNRAILLGNQNCMKQINWTDLELEDYIDHLPELEIQNISNLNDIDEEIIFYALSKINFTFSSSRILCDFIERLPLRFLTNSKVLKYPKALNLFNVNCFLGTENHHFLLKPFSNFLFNIESTTNDWKFQLAELEDFVSTFPVGNEAILDNCRIALINSGSGSGSGSLDLDSSQNYELGYALQNRNYDYISTLNPQKFGHGSFDQYRLILILLGRNDLDGFIKYFDMNLLDHWVILKVIQDRPDIADWLYTTDTDIPFYPLLRVLSLHPPDINTITIPVRISKASEIKNVKQLRDTLRLLEPKQFSSRQFRIELADEAVIDLGGPLLDWITRIIQCFLDFGLFVATPENYFEADAQVFLDPELFKFLGMLHGKLVQIGSGPCWLPTIRTEIILNAKSLLKLEDDPEEAVRLFNEFQFPILSQVNDIKGISIYLEKLEKSFKSWESLAWENYFLGLRLFFNSKVPRQLIKKLLIPSKPPTISGLLALSKVEKNEDIPCNLHELWERILTSFSISHLLKLLLFITGQFKPVPISISFLLTNEFRLPQSRTCFNLLFLYCPRNLSDPIALSDWLTSSLKTSIENYEGFGNI